MPFTANTGLARLFTEQPGDLAELSLSLPLKHKTVSVAKPKRVGARVYEYGAHAVGIWGEVNCASPVSISRFEQQRDAIRRKAGAAFPERRRKQSGPRRRLVDEIV